MGSTTFETLYFDGFLPNSMKFSVLNDISIVTIGPVGRRRLAIMRSELVGLILNALEMSYYYGSLVNSMKFGVLVAGQ